jgi:hypothetical protein
MQGVVGIGLLLAGIGTLGLQIVWFLQTGEWTSLSVMDLMQQFLDPDRTPWVFKPESWLGFHKILEWIPTSFAVFCLGSFVVAAGE